MGCPSSAARLASQSARIERARPSGTQAPPVLRMPPFVTMRARSPLPLSRSARTTSLSLWPSSFSPRPYECAVSNTVIPASAAAAIVSSARRSSRSSSVERRMQPRPTRSSPGPSQSITPARRRARTPRAGLLRPRPPAAPLWEAARTAPASRDRLRVPTCRRRTRRRETSRRTSPPSITARPVLVRDDAPAIVVAQHEVVEAREESRGCERVARREGGAREVVELATELVPEAI